MKNFLALKSSLLLLFSVTWALAQSDLSVTVTNQNLGLVHEKRQIQLQKGVNTYPLTDIPQQIEPTSVLVESPDHSFVVLEQNYEYDLISVSKVLQKSIDQQIWIEDPALGNLSGKLLAASSNYLMLLDDSGTLQFVPLNDKQKVLIKNYTDRQEPFITRPTLVWKVQTNKSGQHPLVMTYLTRGLNWHADYVGKLSQNDQRLHLACWVTIENNSGKVYKNARLKLMAGELNVIKQAFARKSRARLLAESTGAPQFKEKAFFEYHLYTLQRQTTLLNNQIKQIQLFPETEVKVQKKYVVTSFEPNEVQVTISFKNSKQNNLGIPFPAGRVRLYKQDQQDLEFIGEDQISHTPQNEEISLKVGKAFDIVSERSVLKRERIEKQAKKITVEYTIRNHKKQDIVVEVVEHVPTYYENELLSSSVKPIETKADYFKFRVTVKANAEAKLNLVYLTQ